MSCKARGWYEEQTSKISMQGSGCDRLGQICTAVGSKLRIESFIGRKVDLKVNLDSKTVQGCCESVRSNMYTRFYI